MPVHITIGTYSFDVYKLFIAIETYSHKTLSNYGNNSWFKASIYISSSINEIDNL